MRGGSQPEYYSFVIADTLRYVGETTYLRSGFFQAWNRHVDDIVQAERDRAYRDAEVARSWFEAVATAACASEGCTVIYR